MADETYVIHFDLVGDAVDSLNKFNTQLNQVQISTQNTKSQFSDKANLATMIAVLASGRFSQKSALTNATTQAAVLKQTNFSFMKELSVSRKRVRFLEVENRVLQSDYNKVNSLLREVTMRRIAQMNMKPQSQLPVYAEAAMRPQTQMIEAVNMLPQELKFLGQIKSNQRMNR